MSQTNVNALVQARQNICAQIQAITLNPKPNYSVDGRSVSWNEHFSNLLEMLNKIREQEQLESGPSFEVTTFGR